MRTTSEKFRPLSHFGARHPNVETGVPGLQEPARVVPHRGGPAGRRAPGTGGWLVEVNSDEELPAGFCTNLRRILVPTALDGASTTALQYASAVALGLGSELALLYVFEDSSCAKASCVEAELQRCLAAVRAQGVRARLFLHAGLVGEQVKSVASTLEANLIVTSTDYHRRFLSCLAHEDGGALRIQGVPCPVVLVNASIESKTSGVAVPVGRRLCPLDAAA